MLENLVAIAAIVGTPPALVATFFEVRKSLRESREARERAARERENRAAKEATDPLRELLRDMTNDRDRQRDRANDLAAERDFYRNRVAELESELRQRG